MLLCVRHNVGGTCKPQDTPSATADDCLELETPRGCPCSVAVALCPPILNFWSPSRRFGGVPVFNTGRRARMLCSTVGER